MNLPEAFTHLCLPLVVVLFAATVQAQEPEPEITVYETATVEARASDESTATIGLVTQEQIDRAFNLDLADALRLAPGVTTTAAARSSASPVTLRGGDPNFTLVLLDGIPLNDSTDALGGAPDLGAISVLGLERVEVVQGTASWFYGSSALAGVVQLLTRRPTEPRAMLGVGVGNDDRRSASVNLDRTTGTRAAASSSPLFGAGLTLNYDEEEGRLQDEGPAEQQDGFESTSGLLRLMAVPGTRSTIDATVRYVDSEKRDWSEGSGGPLFGSGDTRSNRAGSNRSFYSFPTSLTEPATRQPGTGQFVVSVRGFVRASRSSADLARSAD